MQAKVVGGKTAPPGSHPWQVSLGVSWIADGREAHFCGGTLVDANHIVTAAHCVRGLLPEDFLVVAGTQTLTRANNRYSVASVAWHQAFDRDSFDNDVALVELRDPVPFGKSARAVNLVASIDEESQLVQGKKLRVTGWGATAVGGSSVATLRMIDVPYISRDTCNKSYAYNGDVHENMLCAGDPPTVTGTQILQDACQGDSGGPLIANIASGQPVLVGVTSWGKGCAVPNKYGVYARLSSYLPWIAACRSKAGPC